MKVMYGIGSPDRKIRKCVLAIGVFDGLHLGHQALIKKALKRAQELKTCVVVMTFYPHPVQVLHPRLYMPLIVSLSYRLNLIARLGVHACLVVRFTKQFSCLTPDQFIKKYLVKNICPQEILVGDDFRFGKNRSGTIDSFREAGKRYGFTINAMDSLKGGRKKIGSTVIRTLIAQGKLDKARELLGRYVSVVDVVKKGDGRGNKLGFPTANLYPKNSVVPPIGVYAVNVVVDDKKVFGMANVGRRPSFHRQGNSVNVEVNIFDFKKDLYGREIIVEFVQRIRSERVFNSIENLIKQLKRDEVKAKLILFGNN